MFMLPYEIAVYIPSTLGNDIAPKAMIEKAIDNTLIALSERFGGATATSGIGAWVSDSGELIKESVTIVSSNHDSDNVDALQFAIGIAKGIKAEFKQQAIAVKQNGSLYLV